MAEAIAGQPAALGSSMPRTATESTRVENWSDQNGSGGSAAIAAAAAAAATAAAARMDASSELPIHVHLLAREIAAGTGSRRLVYSRLHSCQVRLMDRDAVRCGWVHLCVCVWLELLRQGEGKGREGNKCCGG